MTVQEFSAALRKMGFRAVQGKEFVWIEESTGRILKVNAKAGDEISEMSAVLALGEVGVSWVEFQAVLEG